MRVKDRLHMLNLEDTARIAVAGHLVALRSIAMSFEQAIKDIQDGLTDDLSVLERLLKDQRDTIDALELIIDAPKVGDNEYVG